MKTMRLITWRALTLAGGFFIVFRIIVSIWFTSEVSGPDTDEEVVAFQQARPSKRSMRVYLDKRQDRETYFRGTNVPDDMLAAKRPHYLPNYKNPCWYETGHESDSPPVTKLRCLPYFHLIGIDKSGTTDLWYRVSQHPHIVSPDAVMKKETHWWSWRRFGFNIWVTDEEIRHFDWYLKHFDKPAAEIERTVSSLGNMTYHHLVTGEGSPTLFWDFTGWNLIPQNKNRSVENAYLTPHCIRHLTPDVKLIVIFRNPTERLYSDYLFLDKFRSYHNVSVAGFHQGVLKSVSMLKHCFSRLSQLECVYNKELHMYMPVRIIVGMYDIFLRHWLKVFPRNQMLILRNEDYSNDIKSFIKHVFDFLQLESLPDSELERIEKLPRVFEKTDKAKDLGPMMPETRHILNQFYSHYNKQLVETLRDSRFFWDSNN